MVVSKMKNTGELVLPDLKPVRFHKSRHCGTPLKKKAQQWNGQTGLRAKHKPYTPIDS